MRLNVVAVAAVCSGVWYANVVAASPLEIEVTETLMEAQAMDHVLLSLMFGPDLDAELDYSWVVDLDARAFSYESAPGASYLGQPFDLSGTGAYVAADDRYEWTSNGALGSSVWTTGGTIKWVGDPVGTGSTEVTLDGFRYKVDYIVVIFKDQDGNDKSAGFYSFSEETPSGNVTVTTAAGVDNPKSQLGWSHRVNVPLRDEDVRFISEGTVLFSSARELSGTFVATQDVVPVPLPGGLILVASAFGLTLLSFGVRRPLIGAA